MNKTKSSSQDQDKISRPLALHVRRLRQWYAKRSLTQQELANLSGIHCRKIRKLESACFLPDAVEQLLAIALALQVPFEVLIAPRLIEGLNQVIADNRQELGLDIDEIDSTARETPYAT